MPRCLPPQVCCVFRGKNRSAYRKADGLNVDVYVQQGKARQDKTETGRQEPRLSRVVTAVAKLGKHFCWSSGGAVHTSHFDCHGFRHRKNRMARIEKA